MTAPAVAQLPARVITDSGMEFLIREGTRSPHVAADLHHLTDVIGPRLSGSAAMRRANEWTAVKLEEYGADSVALESWPFGVTWERGPLTLRMLAPHERWLQAASWAWAPGTRGALAGDGVHLDATTRAEFDARFARRLRGRWVMLSEPFPRVNPTAATPADSAKVDSLRLAMRARSQRMTPEQRDYRARLEELLADEGIAGEIIDGGKDFGLFTMSGSPDDISRYPRVVVAHQTYTELHRLLGAGPKVRVEVSASNTFGRDTVPQWNTVGEIRGREKPDEVVLLGAHLDSWDLGTGATDNASGSVAVLEAARLLGALTRSGLRPRRTIRFALFGGEEQGLYGSQYYAAAHRHELAKFQAVLVLDNGTGRITGLALQGWDELDGLWTEMMRPLAALGPVPIRSGRKTGTDHLAFLPFGVPSFNYDQLSRGYDYTHHSQMDVFDHAVPADVSQAAIIMAVNALQLANLDRLLPRRR
jgi:hypothetical protein